MFRNIWNKLFDNICDKEDSKLKHEHKSKPRTCHLPVLLGEVVGPKVFMVARKPEKSMQEITNLRSRKVLRVYTYLNYHSVTVISHSTGQYMRAPR